MIIEKKKIGRGKERKEDKRKVGERKRRRGEERCSEVK